MELSNKEAANMERSGVWGEGKDLGRSWWEGSDHKVTIYRAAKLRRLF